LVFQDKEIGEFINSRFVSLHVNTPDPDGQLVRKTFRVQGLPTVLFLAPDGEEIDRLCGFDGDKGAWYRELQELVRGEHTLRALLEREKAAPDDVEVQYRLAKRYVARWEGKPAAIHVKRVLQLDPQNQKGYKPECTCLLAIYEADTKQNLQPLRDFIATDPETSLLTLAYTSLAEHHVRQKNPTAAVATFEAALEKIPNQPDLMREYSQAIFQLHLESKYARGLELARARIDLVPDKAGAWLDLGYAYQAMQDFGGARETFLKCRDLYPENMSVVYQLGKNYLLSGQDLDKGLACFAEYLKHPAEGPSWASAHWRMGMIYEKLGDNDRAVAAYEAALKLDPSYEDCKKALAKLKH
jgi:tetratricopeptide (TPR) repeat protein